MDNLRFDSLTRAMAVGKSRRDVLKLLAGGAAGAALTVTLVDNAAAECHGIACSSDTDCCTGAPYCSGGVCAVQMADESPAPEPAPEPAAASDSGGTESVTTAPSTGIGTTGPDNGSWLGAAVAGGAAALIGARVLRNGQEKTDGVG